MTEDDVRAIKKRLAKGDGARDIAQDYHLSTESVRRIARGDTWREVV